MKIVLTGGGSGGHFYPLIAIAEQLHHMIEERKLLEPDLVYIGPAIFDKSSLIEQNISYRHAPAGSIRTYAPGIQNMFVAPRIAWGIVKALFQLFNLYPDVVLSTGGFASFPTLVAARLLQIPVIIYDADAVPGRVTLYAARFARWIGVAHADAPAAFPQAVRSKIALVGHPIRKEIERPVREGAQEYLQMDTTVPTLFVLGGSQGAETINDAIIDALPMLVEKYNIVHQTGAAHVETVAAVANVELKNNRYRERYRAYGLLNALALRMVAGTSSLIISRAGSGTIFEIASWGLPSILIPIPESVSHDQTKNAFSYARTGAALVIEQHNLTPHILVAEIDRLMNDESLRAEMAAHAHAFSRPDAAQKIARIVLDTALEHTN